MEAATRPSTSTSRGSGASSASRQRDPRYLLTVHGVGRAARRPRQRRRRRGTASGGDLKMARARSRSRARIRRKMAFMAAVVTGTVVLAFCIPLALYVRSVAYDRAVDGADVEARSLAAELFNVRDLADHRAAYSPRQRRCPEHACNCLPGRRSGTRSARRISGCRPCATSGRAQRDDRRKGEVQARSGSRYAARVRPLR